MWLSPRGGQRGANLQIADVESGRILQRIIERLGMHVTVLIFSIAVVPVMTSVTPVLW